MLSITNPIGGNESYGYDALDRLTTVTAPYDNVTATFDQIGNLTSIASSKQGTVTYTYPASGASSVRPHAVSTVGSNSYTYDNNGNTLTGSGRTLTYDVENRPTTISRGGVTATIVYDGDGGRVKKTVSGIIQIHGQGTGAEQSLLL